MNLCCQQGLDAHSYYSVCVQTCNLCIVLSLGIWQSLRVMWAGDCGRVRIRRPAGLGPSLQETAEVLGVKLGEARVTSPCAHFMLILGTVGTVSQFLWVFIQYRMRRHLTDAESTAFKKHSKWADNKMRIETRKSAC